MMRLQRALAAAGALLLAAASATAQTYPARHITTVVPFSAGSPGDVFIRIVAAGMSKELGQQVVVEISAARAAPRASRAAQRRRPTATRW